MTYRRYCGRLKKDICRRFLSGLAGGFCGRLLQEVGGVCGRLQVFAGAF